MTAASQAIAVKQTIESVMRADRGRLIAALIARLRDFQLAEEVLQEAVISALSHWGRSGLPASPQGWLLRVALRKAIDRLRGAKRDTRRAAEMAVLAVDEAADTDPDMISDERLRLIFTCCHPALDAKSRVALTLRTLGGLSTPQIARAFLDTDTAMGARLTRAKAKISAAGIPFIVPGPEDWAGRLNSVLTVVYLIFNAGYTVGPTADRDLCNEAIYLCQMLNLLRPDEAEVEGCLALLQITHARRHARTNKQGGSVGLIDQDRDLWDTDMIETGLALLKQAMARRNPGPFQIKAAIAACQAGQGGPDWPQIAALYAGLFHYEPTPVVALNLAVAQAESDDLSTALETLKTLAEPLDTYQPYHAACADLLARDGQKTAALAAYARAIATAASGADAAFLSLRRDKLLA